MGRRNAAAARQTQRCWGGLNLEEEDEINHHAQMLGWGVEDRGQDVQMSRQTKSCGGG